MAAAGEIVNALLTVGANTPLDGVRILDPEKLILKSPNVADPQPLVNGVVVPPSVPVPADNVRSIEMPDVDTLFPNASCN